MHNRDRTVSYKLCTARYRHPRGNVPVFRSTEVGLKLRLENFEIMRDHSFDRLTSDKAKDEDYQPHVSEVAQTSPDLLQTYSY
ncbi:hypothetical protein Y032_0055g2594 [Ancylostoma ceylanicum]|uniref:Uncharacterized protein n=1 Tax=Ancylostoma ceylanicum TaxID=53326 RepID=A0A016U5D3_9BILA|nr:hypothetical protein Y032_0055g2594 [Ancylostoma ceylanicum]